MRRKTSLWTVGVLFCSLCTMPTLAQRWTTQTPQSTEAIPPNTVIETVVADAGGFVVAMVFAPDGRMFYTTKGGTVRVVENDVLRATPFLTTAVDDFGERGLLGITLDPAFSTNHYVYLYKTAPASETGTGFASNRVLRYTEDPATQTVISGSEVLLLDLPIEDDANSMHFGGNLHFGPDDKLYVTIGDYGITNNAQDLANPYGKIHRLNADGSVPSDNPFVNSPANALPSVWSYGHRNSFDFTFDPVNGNLFSTENGPHCDDEINLGQAGGNYAWPNTCDTVPEDTIAPLFRYGVPVALTGIDVYQGPITEWHNTLFWCGAVSNALYHGVLNDERTAFSSVLEVADAPTCSIDVQHDAQGALYVTTENVIRRVRSTQVPTPTSTAVPTPTATAAARIWIPFVVQGDSAVAAP